jgi:hypothetical protein
VPNISVGARRYRSFAAAGNGGQFVIAVPELELVVMIAAGNYGDLKPGMRCRTLSPRISFPPSSRMGTIDADR